MILTFYLDNSVSANSEFSFSHRWHDYIFHFHHFKFLKSAFDVFQFNFEQLKLELNSEKRKRKLLIDFDCQFVNLSPLEVV